MSKILILAPYPATKAPSQRFRFEQYLHLLENEGIEYEYHSFLDERAWSILHKPRRFGYKIMVVIIAFIKRLVLMLKVNSFDKVFIHREASHVGPPIFEYMITQIFKKELIYDFDDAIWLPNYSEHNAEFQKLKMYKKVQNIIKWSSKVSVGNEYLKQYALNYNKQVFINPTTIDTDNYHNPNRFKKENFNRPVIGWTGTLTTAKYLDFLIPVFQKLEIKYDFILLVISNERPILPIKSLKYLQWKKESEIEDLLKFDVGIMPLTDDIWSKGKCGFKALQYMSLGIPAIVSPVGVNSKIVDNNINGYICNTEEEWYDALSSFLKSNKSSTMSISAREKIINNFSVNSNKSNFLSLFR
ncbi:glycosyltransferase family 4 protein [Flammeovirga sp. MY04]|uniref:glycosyltransferase family 4 protein n=1 Tax=Flammeovirga sp. MY04 TaxID=1191459 RepID=UPI00080620D1|nr:glycosyltransferase family 4 protein [Flammeovirga sp. MY04]ANQ48432.1 glycosyltransferase family 4 protein [Flammeovirga sp. MY04]